MGLDIYLTTDRKQSIATIESTDSIDKELGILKQKTGIEIDEYGTTNLYLDHIKLLNDLLNETNDWSKVFKKAIESHSGLVIFGD